MYTVPNANPGIATKGGLMAWAKGAERWMDDRGRKAWIAAMILGFVFAWPVGLGLLAYMIWSKRLFNRIGAQKTGLSSVRGGSWGRNGGPMDFGGTFRSSGNAAFDAYKSDTIRRLQDEQEAFEAFLQRLRDAKDQSEFDSFMADRAKAAETAVVTSAPVIAEPKSDR